MSKKVNTYHIGDLTYQKVFKAAGIENVSDMQIVFDQIEKVLTESNESGSAKFTLFLSEPYHDGRGGTWTNHEELLKAVEKENGRIEYPTGEESSGQFDSLITGTSPSDW